MKNPSVDVLDQAVAAKLAGASSKSVISDFELSHSQFEFHFLRTVPVAQGGLLEHVGQVEFTPENVVALRGYFQFSWGVIAVLCDRSESAVRKAWKDATGKLSQGIRIGHGGRWYLNERELYTDGLQKPGTEISEADVKALGSRRSAALISATEQKLVKKDTAELKAIAASEGVKIQPKATKAQIVKAIVKARTA